jgi:hypothetical protein
MIRSERATTHKDRDGGDGSSAGGDQRIQEVQRLDRRRRRKFLVLTASLSGRQYRKKGRESAGRTHVFDGLERDFFSEQAEVEHTRFREQVEDGWGLEKSKFSSEETRERLQHSRSVMPIPARRIGERPILGAIALPVNSVIGLLSCPQASTPCQLSGRKASLAPAQEPREKPMWGRDSGARAVHARGRRGSPRQSE